MTAPKHNLRGRVVSINLSPQKGTKKIASDEGCFIEEFGLEGDAHAGQGHRQISLLAKESIEKMRRLGLKVGPGDFAENITTEGIDLPKLPVGTLLRIGQGVVIEITQIGKTCHQRCQIYYQAGDCVMPEEGVFARVLQGGTVPVGETIEVIK